MIFRVTASLKCQFNLYYLPLPRMIASSAIPRPSPPLLTPTSGKESNLQTLLHALEIQAVCPRSSGWSTSKLAWKQTPLDHRFQRRFWLVSFCVFAWLKYNRTTNRLRNQEISKCCRTKTSFPDWSVYRPSLRTRPLSLTKVGWCPDAR